MLLRISNNNSAAQVTASKLRFPVRTARPGVSLWHHSSGNPGSVREALEIRVSMGCVCPAPGGICTPGRDKDKQQSPQCDPSWCLWPEQQGRKNFPGIWIHMQKAPQRHLGNQQDGLWQIFSFFLQSVGLDLWKGPPFAQDQHQMCREISQKQDLKGFQHCAFLWWKQQANNNKKNLSLHPFKRANSSQVTKKC